MSSAWLKEDEVEWVRRMMKNPTDVDMDDQGLADWINILTDTLMLGQSSDHIPIVVNNAAVVTNVGETQGEEMFLPFSKKLPVWKSFETENVQQSPHFSPLLEAKEDSRELKAVGLMLTFYALLEEVKNLQLDVSSSTLSSLAIAFAELEKHGFDVATSVSRINQLGSLQDGRAKKEKEKKSLEKNIEALEIEGQKYAEEKMDLGDEKMELQSKILELERQESIAKGEKEAVDAIIIEEKAGAETIDQEIEDMKLEFETTVSAPW